MLFASRPRRCVLLGRTSGLSAVPPQTPAFRYQPVCFSSTRVDLILKERAVGTRTYIKELIRRQKVLDDSGKKILSAAQKVSPDAVFFVDGQAVRPIPLLALFHKPVGMLSTMGDPYDRPNLLHKLQQINQCTEHSYLKSMHPVGRLDADTSGLLLFSSDGKLTNLLLQPESNITRVYVAVVCGLVDFEALRSELAGGVKTTDGIFPAMLLESFHIQYDVSLTDSFKSQKDLDVTLKRILEHEDLSKPVLSRIRVSVAEGKHRMVRRILHNAGHSVVQLKRMSYGDICLGDLEVGQFQTANCSAQKWARKLLNPQKKKN